MKKTLKLIAIVLAFAVCMSTVAVAGAAEFTDVDSADYFYDAVQWGVEAGITNGVGNNLFDPEGEVTRAQVVTFLWNMAGKPEQAVSETFSDVEAGSWYEKAVAWAFENQITDGTGNGLFSPDVVCNRAMCITLLYRLMGSPLDEISAAEAVKLDPTLEIEDVETADLSESMIKELVKTIRDSNIFTDVPENSYYELAVIWANLNSIITEDNTGKLEEGSLFRAEDPCVRKEMISFLYQTKLLNDFENMPFEIYFGEDIVLPVPMDYIDNEILAIDVVGLSGSGEADAKEEVGIIVSESASKKAAEALGEELNGQGELFRVIRVSEDKLNELLCGDMSGMEVFAMDKENRYYIICYPTDVRYVRETNEKMNDDIDKWTALTGWANDNLQAKIIEYSHGLSPVKFTNTILDIHLARIAYGEDVNYTISTNEFGALEPGNVDGSKYAEYLIGGNFVEADDAQAPDGQYVVLSFPEDNSRYDFFEADKNLVREVRNGEEKFYRCVYPNSESNTDIMLNWYHDIAEQAGKKAE